MNTGFNTTLQINLAPTDLLHAKYILPHQLKQWAKQVNDILLVVDLHQSRGRFSEGWHERLPGLRQLIEAQRLVYPRIRVEEVDYSEAVATQLASLFFDGRTLPQKDFLGGPFYSYFFGLYAAKYDYILHMDSDMMFGGSSSTWITEAVQLLRENTDALICSPLPGPPTSNGQLISQTLEPVSLPFPAFRAKRFSTRIFFLDRRRFYDRIRHLPLSQPAKHLVWRARAEGNPPYDLPEVILTHALLKHGLERIDFSGSEPGMWSLHPPYRSSLFYESLPALIQQIETGNVPEEQRGCHDLNESMIDWSSAKKTFSQRALTHLKLILREHT